MALSRITKLNTCRWSRPDGNRQGDLRLEDGSENDSLKL